MVRLISEDGNTIATTEFRDDGFSLSNTHTPTQLRARAHDIELSKNFLHCYCAAAGPTPAQEQLVCHNTPSTMYAEQRKWTL